MKDLVHRCRQGRRCKARERDDAGEYHGAGVERPDSLCRPCEEHAFADIRQLSDDYDLLYAARTEQRSQLSGQKVSGSTDLPIPIPLAVDTLMSQIGEEALRWAIRLPNDDPSGVGACLAVICSNLGTLVDLPPQQVTVWIPHPDGGDSTGRTVFDGVDAVLRLSGLHHRSITVLCLEKPKDQTLHESCHVCGRAMLTASVRTNLITCRGCHNVWDQDQFASLNNPLVAA